MSELSLSCVLGLLCIVALALISYLTFNIKALENDLEAVKQRVHEHTSMIAENGHRLHRVENLIITNSGKLNNLLEASKQCHENNLKTLH